MSSRITLLLYTSLFLIACQRRLAPQTPGTVNMEVMDQSGHNNLLGKATRDKLKTPPYGEWFNKNYENYIVDTALVGQLRSHLAGKRVLIFLGTWCGDSRREVPRFLKLMDCCGVDAAAIEIVTVSNTDSLYKMSPAHEEKGYDIFRVPDLIVLDRHGEMGRIVESPVVSLEKDLLAIVSGGPYTPRYQGGAFLAGLVRKKGLGALQGQVPELAEKLRPMVSGPGELSSYARTLVAAGEVGKAALVKELNARLYPGQ